MDGIIPGANERIVNRANY